MTKDELSAWALANGWTLIAGHPSLTKPQRMGSTAQPEAVVRLVLKATVAHVEAKKPAGKWEKIAGASYADITPPDPTADDGAGIPAGLSLDVIPGFRMLMQENRDRQVFARW